ncbi:hypothetical protein I9725_001758 [Citrobacter freundii]
MHTVSSVPPSPTGTHLMPVSAPTQERFLRLPEVIHQCGLSRYPDRHQPVFFYLKSRKVNSKVFTVHGLFTVYHIEIKDK